MRSLVLACAVLGGVFSAGCGGEEARVLPQKSAEEERQELEAYEQQMKAQMQQMKKQGYKGVKVPKETDKK